MLRRASRLSVTLKGLLPARVSVPALHHVAASLWQPVPFTHSETSDLGLIALLSVLSLSKQTLHAWTHSPLTSLF